MGAVHTVSTGGHLEHSSSLVPSLTLSNDLVPDAWSHTATQPTENKTETEKSN